MKCNRTSRSFLLRKKISIKSSEKQKKHVKQVLEHAFQHTSLNRHYYLEQRKTS